MHLIHHQDFYKRFQYYIKSKVRRAIFDWLTKISLKRFHFHSTEYMTNQ